MPDNRRIVVSMQDKHDEENEHLWIVDVDSGARRQITNGTTLEAGPAVSPDGKKILFQEVRRQFEFISVSLETGAAERIYASQISAGMPVWAAHDSKLVYVSNRNGPPEIWEHSSGSERPLVTPAQFPQGSTSLLMNPALSPDGNRLAYVRVGADSKNVMWISAATGGTPVRLTNEEKVEEFGGSWSPDGKSIVYVRIAGGRAGLAVVRTSGEAAPAPVVGKYVDGLPEWSPDGQWIKYKDESDGWVLLSPDGRKTEGLGKELHAIEMTFSKDGKTLYGIRKEQGRPQLFTLDVRTKAVKAGAFLDNDLEPHSYLNPGIRLSLSPDGKSILYAASQSTASLWMLEGFE
jgi:Tol biopolymer transport system component